VLYFFIMKWAGSQILVECMNYLRRRK